MAQANIDIFPDKVLLETFGFRLVEEDKVEEPDSKSKKKKKRTRLLLSRWEMIYACSCLPKIANNRVCVTMSSGPTNLLHAHTGNVHKTSEGDVGCLANPADRHLGLPAFQCGKAIMLMT
jgi:hypothetical protein